MDARKKDRRGILLALTWAPYFIAPFFWPNIVIAPVAVDLAALATGLFAAASMSVGEDPRIIPTDWKPLAFFIFLIGPTAILLSNNIIRSPWHAWRECLYLGAAWLVFSMSKSSSSSLLASRAWAYLLAITAHLYVIYAVLQAFNMRFFAGDRLFGIWSERIANFPGPLMQQNWQALFLVISIVFLWRQLEPCKKRIWHNNPTTYEILSYIPICGLFLTSSRSGFIALLFGLILVLGVAGDKTHTFIRILRSLLFGGCLSAIIIYFAPDSLGTNIVERVQDGSYMTRLLIWDMAIHLFIEHPLLGVGLGNMPAHGVDGVLLALSDHPWLAPASSQMAGGHAWAHNFILQLLAEAGLVGLVCAVLLAWLPIQRYWILAARKAKFKHSEVIGCVNGAIASIIILIHGMVSVSIMQPFFMMILALFLSAQPPSQSKKSQTVTHD